MCSTSTLHIPQQKLSLKMKTIQVSLTGLQTAAILTVGQNAFIFKYQMYFWSMYYQTIKWIKQKCVGQMCGFIKWGTRGGTKYLNAHFLVKTQFGQSARWFSNQLWSIEISVNLRSFEKSDSNISLSFSFKYTVHEAFYQQEMKAALAQPVSCCGCVKHQKIMHGIIPQMFDCWATELISRRR